MRITVFGATGATGRLLVGQALTRGVDVTAFTRSPQATFDGAVRVTTGDARDSAAVHAAIADTDAVVSVMGLGSRTDSTHDLSDATRTVADAMADAGVRRIVTTTNNSVFNDDPVKGPYAAVAEEHRRDVAILRESDLDWTVVAPPWLKDDPPTGRYRAVPDAPGPGRSIPRADLATCVLDALGHDDWIGHIVGVTD